MKKLKQTQAFIFDLDGTLIDSLTDIALSTNYALDQMGFPTHPIEAYKTFIGHGIHNLCQQAHPSDQPSEHDVHQLVSYLQNHYQHHWQDHTAPFPGVIDTLKTLKQNNHRLAILSNKPHHHTVKIANILFPSNLFDIIFGAQDTFPTKPDPQSTIHILNQLNISTEQSYFIGDSSIDIETALRAKVKAIGVSWGLGTHHSLQQSGAHVILDQISDLLNHLK